MTMAKGRWDGAFDGCGCDGVPSGTELVDVLQHDDAGFHGHTKQGEEPYAGRYAEMRSGHQQGQQAADGGDGHVGEYQTGPLCGSEHGV